MANQPPKRIYRQAWYGRHPKSVALRRGSDYHTGLSFSLTPPAEGPFLVYGVERLEREGYTIEVDSGKAVVSRWGADWALRDHAGEIRTYSADHVSVFHDHERWLGWYQAELAVGGSGSSHESQRFFDLAEDYREG
jgi:hypothetical protein